MRTHYRFRGAGLALCGADTRHDSSGDETTGLPSYVTCPMCRADLADLGMADDTPAVDVTTPHAEQVRAFLVSRYGADMVTDAMVASVLITEQES